MNQIEISGCSRIQETLVRYKIAESVSHHSKIKISFEQEVEQGKGHCLWFGGGVVSIEFEGYIFYISARGDVEIDLVSKENSRIVASVKDRANNGVFSSEMSGYIENDAMISRLFNESDPQYAFQIYQNNWYEMSIKDKEGEVHCDYETLDAELIFDAIAEVAGCMQEMIDELENKMKK